jgi:hypothetical protein
MRDWFIFEEIPRTHYHLFEGVFDYWGRGMQKDIGTTIDALAVFKRGNMYFCFPKKQFSKVGKTILKKVLKNPKFLHNQNNKTRKFAAELIKSSKKIQKMNFSKLNDPQLEKVFSAHMDIHNKCHASGMLAILVEWEHELLSNYLKDYLKEKIQEKNLNLKPNEIFSILTIPLEDSFQIKQEREAVEIALKILKKEKTAKLFRKKDIKEIIKLLPLIDKKIDKEIEVHYKKFLWIPFMFCAMLDQYT